MTALETPALPAARNRAPSRSGRAAIGLAYGLLPLVVLIAAWTAAVEFFAIPGYLVPHPWAVANAMIRGLSSGSYITAAQATLSAILAGFGVGSAIGALLAIAMVSLPALEKVLFPYVVALQSMPKIAIAPLMIVWFGFGFESKVAIVALVAAFPVLVNTIAGLRSTERERVELIRALSGNRWHVLWHVQIPSALPYVFAGLSSALVLSVTGAIVGEFVGARQGIGVMILQANFNLDLASVFALLLLLGAMAAILNFLLRALGNRIVFWTARP